MQENFEETHPFGARWAAYFWNTVFLKCSSPTLMALICRHRYWCQNPICSNKSRSHFDFTTPFENASPRCLISHPQSTALGLIHMHSISLCGSSQGWLLSCEMCVLPPHRLLPTCPEQRLYLTGWCQDGDAWFLEKIRNRKLQIRKKYSGRQGICGK